MQGAEHPTRTVDVRRIRADDLRYLAAVADTGRLIAAARHLGVDHSTVSRRLQALEGALGTRLIGRGDDGWVLTVEGRIVAEHARVIQRAVEDAARSMASVAPDDLIGTVRVTAGEGFGTRFVAPAVTRLRRRHPGLNVELLTGVGRPDVRQANFDIAIIAGEATSSRVLTERLGSYDSAFHASSRYLAEHGDPESVEELQHHRLIHLGDSPSRASELEVSTYVPGATVGFAASSIFALLEATRRGGGIALLPKFMVEMAPELRRVAAPVPPARVTVSLAMRKGAARRGEVQAVRLALHQEVLGRLHELTWHR
ncbi:LysR family transcriptional regulator [Aeromicrobium chenweiae]|uniref:LysR family transcriptional regulator n=1 Tax=Aeromicrobium chenweiae TaxID=2079793 RepID=A0A2S0WKV3_9ACTN|nr:LysR family transcriptional regulator [Aeromicrobium chenweiae]AWB91904.1 LysR family transcriptional regulator [Aeromicrobium chenweiae]TGN32753.1 LysR family transcriptional regulator [Aeromicrobium chenweiae]